MKRAGILAAGLILILLAISCQAAAPNPVVPLPVTVIEGSIEIQPAGKTAFEPLHVGQSVLPGDQLRSNSATSYAELRDSRSFFVLGPLAAVTIDRLSSTPELTTIRLVLQKGSVLVAADEKLGDGYFEVGLPGGTSAVIHGSAMVVSTGQQAGGAAGAVTCTQGTATVNSAGGSMQLSTGMSMTIGMNGTLTASQPGEGKVFMHDPDLQAVIDDRYYKNFAQFLATFTPEPTLTPTRVRSATPTPRDTWTPFPTLITSTPVVAVGGPTRRPTVTVVPGFNGPTPEELANQGNHTFDVTCQAYAANCVCDSALANPTVKIPIVFDNGGVTLGDASQQLRYEKVWPNLYRVVQNNTTAEITFLPEGWEFYVLKGGTACTLQTFTRR